MRKRLTQEQFEAVQYGLEKGMDFKEISKLTGVSETSIKRIRDGEHYLCKKHETGDATSGTATAVEVLVNRLNSIEALLLKTNAMLEEIAKDTHVVADDLIGGQK